MKFIKMNKYLLKSILSFINKKYRLNLIKYNKKLMSKLDISLYSIQKEYFYSIITETLLNNEDILNKIFGEETLNKLISDFENDKNGIYEDKNLFEKITDLQTYKTLQKAEKFNKKLTNLIELNLCSIDNIELPYTILSNLEKLSLENISNLKFLTNESNITLNKLKYFQINNIIISEENVDIKIKMDNLIYLDIRLEMSDDEKQNFEDYDDIVIFFENLNNLIKIFDFDFLTLFLSSEITYANLVLDNYIDLKNRFKNSKGLFKQKKIVEKFNYFNFEIIFGIVNYPCEFYSNEFISRYSFYKSINNKFCFESYFESHFNTDINDFSRIKEEVRICNNRNYDNYYFINKEMTIIMKGVKDDNSIDMIDEGLDNDELNINTFKVLKNKNLWIFYVN